MASYTPIRRNLFAMFQKRFLSSLSSSAATATLSPKPPLSASLSSSSFKVEFLVNLCGLTSKSATSVSKKFQLDEKNIQKAQSLVQFLKAHDFNNAHIANLIEKWPRVLHCRLEDNLRPKFDFLRQFGFVDQLLPQLIVSNPVIVKMALDSRIKPSFEFLKLYFGSNANIVEATKRDSCLLRFDFKHMQPNIDFLTKEGVPVDRIAKLMMLQPRTIQQKHHRMVYAVNALKNLDIDSKTPIFIHALRVMLQMSESTWNKKVEVLKSLGWTEEEILQAFKRCPFCFTCSEEKIRSVVDFLVNTLKMDLRNVIARPEFLMLSVDKRIRPRYNVLKILESKKLIVGNKNMKQLLAMKENNFFENYVTKYADKVPGLLEAYEVLPRQ